MTEYHRIAPDEAKELLDNGQAILIDVREEEEYQVTNIPNAVLHPLSSFDPSEVENDNKEIIVQCRSGRRSMDACEQLLEAGVEQKVYNLEGGILAWEEEGYPVNY